LRPLGIRGSVAVALKPLLLLLLLLFELIMEMLLERSRLLLLPWIANSADPRLFIKDTASIISTSSSEESGSVPPQGELLNLRRGAAPSVSKSDDDDSSEESSVLLDLWRGISAPLLCKCLVLCI
jgi:hypothetical protein